MNKKKYESVKMRTFVLPVEDIVSTSTPYDRATKDVYNGGDWVDENFKTEG